MLGGGSPGHASSSTKMTLTKSDFDEAMEILGLECNDCALETLGLDCPACTSLDVDALRTLGIDDSEDSADNDEKQNTGPLCISWTDLDASGYDHEFERLHELNWAATKTLFPVAAGAPRRRETRNQRKLKQSCKSALVAHCKRDTWISSSQCKPAS